MRNDVLIIGAGPSGLLAAAELARHGVTDVRLIEREVRPHHEARATVIQPGTLEILDAAGVLSPFLAAAVQVRRTCMYDAQMSELRSASFAGIDCCYDFQCALPQWETQRILEEHLASLGGRVERGVTALKLELNGDDLLVELVHANGRVETVQPGVVIGAGGAHSLTRQSMSELLDGATYEGNFLVADIAMPSPFPPGEAGIVCGPDGFLLLSPLPGGRWISFQDLEEMAPAMSAEQVVARVETRLGGRRRPTDVAWFSPFRMQRRIVSRLADGRRFLIGDAAHLSSPFGGEGLNSGLHDAWDLAWKLALVLRGQGRRSLLDDYQAERLIADRHVLAVSDQVHSGIVGIADTVRQRRPVPPAVVNPAADALLSNARAMIDVDYALSPLVADHDGSSQDSSSGGRAPGAEPHPGRRFPDWTKFRGASHHLLVFGPVAAVAQFERLSRRWSHCVQIARDPDVGPARAGVPAGGMVLIRPDGHIGFRSSSTAAAGFAALDRHLASYLVSFQETARAA